jgi:hypothetical protein
MIVAASSSTSVLSLGERTPSPKAGARPRPSPAQPEDQPPPEAERLGHLGDQHRGAVRHTEHTRRGPDPGGRRSDEAEHRPRLVARSGSRRVTCMTKADLDELYAADPRPTQGVVEAFETQSQNVRRLVEEHIFESGRLLERALEEAERARSDFRRRFFWADSVAAKS